MICVSSGHCNSLLTRCFGLLQRATKVHVYCKSKLELKFPGIDNQFLSPRSFSLLQMLVKIVGTGIKMIIYVTQLFIHL